MMQTKWIEHALNVANEMEKLIDERADELAQACMCIQVDPDVARNAIVLAAALHDFCKLTEWWQNQVGVPSNASATELIAHSPNEPKYTAFPLTAYALHDALFQFIPHAQLARTLLLALAQQRRQYARIVPRYQLHPAWRDALNAVLEHLNIREFPSEKIFTSQKSSTAMRAVYPSFAAEHLYELFLQLLHDAHQRARATNSLQTCA